MFVLMYFQANCETSTTNLVGFNHKSLSSPTSSESPSTSPLETSSVGDKKRPKYQLCDSPPNQVAAKRNSGSVPQKSSPILSDSNNNKVVLEQVAETTSERKSNLASRNSGRVSSAPSSNLLASPLQTGSSQFFYHPSPLNPFMNAGITPFCPPQAVYPLYMQYPIMSPIPSRPFSSSDVARITELVSSTTLSEEESVDGEGSSKSSQLSGSKLDKNANVRA